MSSVDAVDSRPWIGVERGNGGERVVRRVPARTRKGKGPAAATARCSSWIGWDRGCHDCCHRALVVDFGNNAEAAGSQEVAGASGAHMECCTSGLSENRGRSTGTAEKSRWTSELTPEGCGAIWVYAAAGSHQGRVLDDGHAAASTIWLGGPIRLDWDSDCGAGLQRDWGSDFGLTAKGVESRDSSEASEVLREQSWGATPKHEIEEGAIRVCTRHNMADVMTKALGNDQHWILVKRAPEHNEIILI